MDGMAGAIGLGSVFFVFVCGAIIIGIIVLVRHDQFKKEVDYYSRKAYELEELIRTFEKQALLSSNAAKAKRLDEELSNIICQIGEAKNSTELQTVRSALDTIGISYNSLSKADRDLIYVYNVRVASKQSGEKYNAETFFKTSGFTPQNVLGKLDSYPAGVPKFCKVSVRYTSPAGKVNESWTIKLTYDLVKKYVDHPELLMTKSDANKFTKEQAKQSLENKKKEYYDRINHIIDIANDLKANAIIPESTANVDYLVSTMFERTIPVIQKTKSIDSVDWITVDKCITDTSVELDEICELNRKIDDYYKSEEFSQLKATCDGLMQSQKDFNQYIEEKAESIATLFGTKVTRNETRNDDTYNYIRPYAKTVNPFVAEVSQTVFASAENNPLDYVIKQFYPNKSQYKEQIQKLQVLIGELETLRDAKNNH